MPYWDATPSFARRHVVEGEVRVARMQALIAAAVERGHSAELAIRVLDAMIVTLAIMVDQEHRIEAERKRRNAFKTPTEAETAPTLEYAASVSHRLALKTSATVGHDRGNVLSDRLRLLLYPLGELHDNPNEYA
jgi:hypothetical protein